MFTSSVETIVDRPINKETILINNSDALVRRIEYPFKRLSLLDDIYVEKGDLSDWKQLHELHYKAENLGIGPRYFRCAVHGKTIGVLVLTVPKPLDSGRNLVFPHLRPNAGGRDNRLVNQARMLWINKNLILSSRNVLDTTYRGAGIAYRFRNLAFRMSGKKFIEARSSMSRFNPFYQKAGAKLLPPKPSACHLTGLKFFARHFKSMPSDYMAVMDELNSMPKHLQDNVMKEIREFYYKNSSMEKSGDNRMNGTSRIDVMSTPYLMKQVQQLVFGSTIYAIYENPDWTRTLPDRIPLGAFDNQATNEPLRLDLL